MLSIHHEHLLSTLCYKLYIENKQNGKRNL